MKEREIQYKTRDIGYGSEEGIATAYLTDEIDTWGKRTILVLEGDTFRPWYLFEDEYEVLNGES